MARISKYAGGSKEISFRLPLVRFDEAKKAVEAVLLTFEKDYVVSTEVAAVVSLNADEKKILKKMVPPETIDKLKELDPNIVAPEWATSYKQVVKKGIPERFKLYPCGCTFNGLFRRRDGCKVSISDHK